MKRIRSMSLALILTVVFISAVTIAGELSEGVKNILKALTGHHWITKSLLSLILFFGTYIFVKKSDDKIDILRESKRIFWVIILACAILFGFFLWDAMFR